MAAQDIRDLIPRVRRAIEGPVPLDTGALSDTQVEALTADCIADIILLTGGEWGHTLERDVVSDPPNEHWTVDPALEIYEESMVAAQAAITHFFHMYKDVKTSERVRNEAQEWEWSTSASLLRDYLDLLIKQRDEALAALKADNPVLARYASFLEVRDRVVAGYLEPWTMAGAGGITLQ